jgi:hypothetical protein
VLAWQSAAASRTARHGVHAGLEAADGDDLVLRPNSDGEGAGFSLQDGLGAIAGAVERQDNATAAQPDEGGAQQLCLAAWPAAGNWNCAWAKKKQKHLSTAPFDSG